MRALVWLLVFACAGAQAAQVETPVASLTLPDGWATQRDFMGLVLLARPGQQADPAGWRDDLLMLASQPRRRGQSLAKAAEERLAQIGYNSKSLRIIDRLPSANRQVLRLHIQLQSPQKALEGQLLMAERDQQLVSVLITTTYTRYPGRAATFTKVLDSVSWR